MATIKSFTSLEQSKKLAEIVPPESADMRYAPFGDTHPWFWDGHLLEKEAIPCWSLATLLELMPKQFGRYTKSLYWFDNAWHCDYMDEDSESKIGVSADNPIDACIKMIYKLKEICAI